MKETSNTSAIILKRRPFRESDTLVTLYSREKGKLDLVARGTKKLKSKLAGHLEPITLSEIMIVPGRQFDYIGTADSQDCFVNIKTDLEKISLAGKMISVFNKLVKEEEVDEKIFDLLAEFLDSINKETEPIENYDFVFCAFLYQLLLKLGYGFNFSQCSICEEKILDGARFDFKKGGLVCHKCFQKTSTDGLISFSSETKKMFLLTNAQKCDILIRLKTEEKTMMEYVKSVNLFFKYNF